MTGFVAGQLFLLNTEILNPSSVAVRSLKIAILKTVTFQSDWPQYKSKIKYTTIYEDVCNATVKNSTKAYTKYIKVPLVSPSTLGKSNVIDVSYSIVVEAETNRFHNNPCITIPITVGTAPFYQQKRTRAEAVEDCSSETLENAGNSPEIIGKSSM